MNIVKAFSGDTADVNKDNIREYVGSIWTRNNYFYMLSQVEGGVYKMIGLSDGNRFSDPSDNEKEVVSVILDGFTFFSDSVNMVISKVKK